MEIKSSYNLSAFKSRCPDIKLGQDVCTLVNKEFPHCYLTKYKPLIKKHISKTKHSAAIMNLIMKFNDNQISFNDDYEKFFIEFFNMKKKYKFFNCNEASLLSELILKLNGIKNSYTARIHDELSSIDHIVSFFNRDGSEYDGTIKNGETIIVDPYTGICDVANNYFAQLGKDGQWQDHFQKITQDNEDINTNKYHFDRVRNIDMSNDFWNYIKETFPNLILKNQYKKR